MSGYALGQNDAGRNSGGGFMDGNGSWVWILVIFALLFGWGGNGNWGGGNNGGGGAAVVPYIGGIATRADINEGFALNGIENGIRSIQQGICDSTYALNNAINNGFHGVDRGLCDLGYALKDCCCQTQRAIDGVNYNMATQACDTRQAIATSTRDIIENQNANTRSILDFLVSEKLSSKDARIAELTNQLSQSQQSGVIRAAIDASTAEILRRSGHDCPSAAYLVQPPTPVNFPVNGCGTVQFGGNGYGCGGCGCCA